MLLYAFEVTEQVLARKLVEASREEARRSAEQLKTITDTLPALVAYVDAAQRYRFTNRTYEAGSARSPSKSSARRSWSSSARRPTRTSGSPSSRPCRARPSATRASWRERTGGRSYTQSSYIPERDERGQVRGFVVLALDITERKRAEEAVRNAVRLRDEFLSVASHELKTPLTP